MPIYEYQCEDTGNYFEIDLPSIQDYDPAAVRSPFTGSRNVRRIIREVHIKQGGHLAALADSDENLLHDLEHSDSAALGRALHEMASETGEDLGGEFYDIVDRLEAGQSPDEIEASLPDPPHQGNDD